MNWNDAWQIIVTAVGAVGGVGVIIVGLSAWMGNIWANRFAEKYRLSTEQQIKTLEAEHAKELSRLQQQLSYEYESKLEVQKQMLQVEMIQNQRFLEKQFDLYMSLWDKLQELRFAGDKLWHEASKENMMEFSDAVQQTRLIAEKVSLVMDNGNYQRLRRLLERFERFRIGKRNLIELRTRNSVRLAYDEYVQYGGSAERFQQDIEEQIGMNRSYRNEYENLLGEIRQELQAKLARSPLADNLRSIAGHMMVR